jgi:hypothetical protein
MYSTIIPNIFTLVKGKPEGKKPLRRPGSKENNISMDLEEIG